MDLENFNAIDESPLLTTPTSGALSTKEALEQIDGIWYIAANRRARWMDLLGDYAGSEPFVLDGTHDSTCSLSHRLTSSSPMLSGESLFQIVLDDPLLAIAREGGE